MGLIFFPQEPKLANPFLSNNSKLSVSMIRPHRCPVCESKLEPDGETFQSLFPFCSERRRSIDLIRWFDGRYKVVDDIDPYTAELLQHDPGIDVQNDLE